MTKRNVTIKNKSGLHARPASEFSTFIKKYDADILLIKDGKEVNAKSIINLLSLGVKKDSEITISVHGENEETVCNEVVQYLENLID